MHWIIKASIQKFLASIPYGENINHLFQRRNYRKTVRHVEKKMRDLHALHGLMKKENAFESAEIVEVGSGWIPSAPVLLYLLGAKRTHTYDHVRHLRQKQCREVIDVCRTKLPDINTLFGMPVDVLTERLNAIHQASGLEAMLESMHISYHAPGDATRTGLADNSCDIYFSLSVMEHIPEDVIGELAREAMRVLRPGGIFYNQIGLHDHYVSFDRNISRVNFLKYPEGFWSFFAKNNVFYHNRLRESQFIGIFEEAGFNIIHVNSIAHEEDIEMLKRMRLDHRLRTMEIKDLATTFTAIYAEKPHKFKKGFS